MNYTIPTTTPFFELLLKKWFIRKVASPIHSPCQERGSQYMDWDKDAKPEAVTGGYTVLRGYHTLGVY